MNCNPQAQTVPRPAPRKPIAASPAARALLLLASCVLAWLHGTAAYAEDPQARQLPIRYRVLVLQDESYSMSAVSRPADPYGLRHLLAGFTADILELSGPPNEVGLSIFGSRLDEVAPLGNAFRAVRERAVYFDPKRRPGKKAYLERAETPMGMLTDYRFALATELDRLGAPRTVSFQGRRYRLEPVIILLTDGRPNAWPGDPFYGDIATEYLQLAAQRSQPASRYPSDDNFPGKHYQRLTTEMDIRWFRDELASRPVQINALAWGKDAPTELLEEITLASGGHTNSVFAAGSRPGEVMRELTDVLRQVIVMPDNILSLGQFQIQIPAGRTGRKSLPLPRNTERVLVRFDFSARTIPLLDHGKTLPPGKVLLRLNGVVLTPENANFYNSISHRLKKRHADAYRPSLLAVSAIQQAGGRRSVGVEIENRLDAPLPVTVELYAARHHSPHFELTSEPKRVLNDGTPAFCRNDPLSFTFQVRGKDGTPYPLRSVAYQLWSKTGIQSVGELTADRDGTTFTGDGIPLPAGTTALTLTATMAESGSGDTSLRIRRRLVTLDRKDPHFLVVPLDQAAGPLPDPQAAAEEAVHRLDLAFYPFDRNGVRGIAPAYAVLLDPYSPCFTGPRTAQPLALKSARLSLGGAAVGTLEATVTGVLRKGTGGIEPAADLAEIEPGDYALIALRFRRERDAGIPLSAIDPEEVRKNGGCQDFDAGLLSVGSTRLPVRVRLCLPLEKLKLRVK